VHRKTELFDGAGEVATFKFFVRRFDLPFHILMTQKGVDNSVGNIQHRKLRPEQMPEAVKGNLGRQFQLGL
jgi:hypothetical protein